MGPFSNFRAKTVANLYNLYQVIAPNSYKPKLRRKSKSGRNAKSSNKASDRKY